MESEDEAYKVQLQDYKTQLQSVYEKSQDAFEKQLSYLSGGSLGLSILFIEKVVTNIRLCNWKLALASSWVLLACTLLVNLISHFVSKRNVYKTIEEINSNTFDADVVTGRNNQVDKLNISTIISFSLGILLLIIFVCKNTMSEQINTPSQPDLQKGLTGPPAPKPQTGQVPPPPVRTLPEPVVIPPNSR